MPLAQSIKVENGTSLLELILVLSISSLILTGGAYALKNSLQKNSLRQTAYLLESEIQLSKTFAAHSGCTGYLSLSEHELEYFLEADCNSGPREGVVSIPPTVTIRSNQSLFRFYATGVVTPGRIELIRNNYSCSLILSLRGRTRLECSDVK